MKIQVSNLREMSTSLNSNAGTKDYYYFKVVFFSSEGFMECQVCGVVLFRYHAIIEYEISV
jgi:hypothetical protein